MGHNALMMVLLFERHQYIYRSQFKTGEKVLIIQASISTRSSKF